MAKVVEEATYVAHHPQKIALIFSAMRHFAKELKAEGWRVRYHAFQFSQINELKKIKKQYLPEKICAHYLRSFTWRKKMARLLARSTILF